MSDIDLDAIRQRRAKAERWHEGVHYGLNLYAASSADVPVLLAEVERLRQHILDIDAHATPFGDIPDEPGYVGTYLVTAGALHRALGKIGHTAPNCAAEAELGQAHQRIADLERERDEVARLVKVMARTAARTADERDEALKVVLVAEAWRADPRSALGLPHALTETALIAAVDLYREGRDGS